MQLAVPVQQQPATTVVGDWFLTQKKVAPSVYSSEEEAKKASNMKATRSWTSAAYSGSSNSDQMCLQAYLGYLLQQP